MARSTTKRAAGVMAMIVALAACVGGSAAAAQAAQATQAAQAAQGNDVSVSYSYSSGGGGGPCIECKDCSTSNCWSVCQQSCSGSSWWSWIPVDGNWCKAIGASAAQTASAKACKTALTFCNGGSRPLGALGAFVIPLSQCGNVAVGRCEQVGLDQWRSPCGYAFNGVAQCSGSQFRQFYSGEITGECRNQLAGLPGVKADSGSGSGSGSGSSYSGGSGSGSSSYSGGGGGSSYSIGSTIRKAIANRIENAIEG